MLLHNPGLRVEGVVGMNPADFDPHPDHELPRVFDEEDVRIPVPLHMREVGDGAERQVHRPAQTQDPQQREGEALLDVREIDGAEVVVRDVGGDAVQDVVGQVVDLSVGRIFGDGICAAAGA